MSKTERSNSILFGWLEAGVDVVNAQISQVTDIVNRQISSSQALFEELQKKGEEVDAQLREHYQPTRLFTALQEVVMANPLYQWLSWSPSKSKQRDQQLDKLSAKIDVLVEQVAQLAAVKAAAKKAQAVNKEATPASPQSSAETPVAAAKPTRARRNVNKPKGE